jgi:hypothetical protein
VAFADQVTFMPAVIKFRKQIIDDRHLKRKRPSWRVIIDRQHRATICQELYSRNRYYIVDPNGNLLLRDDDRIGMTRRDWEWTIAEMLAHGFIPTREQLAEKRQRQEHAPEFDQIIDSRKAHYWSRHLYAALKMVQRCLRDGTTINEVHRRCIDDALDRVDGIYR